MKILIKFIIKLCFGIWLITSILPETVIMDHKMIISLFQASKILGIIIIVMTFIAFFNPMFSKKKQTMINEEKTRLILHDLDTETAEKLFQDVKNALIFSVRKKMIKCCGCFDCWLRTPGLCVMHDGTESLGKQIACCDEFIIICKSLYGGFGKEIKTALDRSISFVLPFFEVRNREQHHQTRFSKSGKMKAYIYNSGEISDIDKTTLTEITRANCINMNKSECETVFVNDVQELKGALT